MPLTPEQIELLQKYFAASQEKDTAEKAYLHARCQFDVLLDDYSVGVVDVTQEMMRDADKKMCDAASALISAIANKQEAAKTAQQHIKPTANNR